MANDNPIYYWDSCVFLAAVDAEQDRVPVIEALLDECESGKVTIVTSHLSITEVCFAKEEKTGGKLSKQTADRILVFWDSSSPIKTAEVDEIIARNAQTLIRLLLGRGRALKPADAIHLATAKTWGVTEFHTYDQKLFRCEQIMGFKIYHPHVGQMQLFPPAGSPLKLAPSDRKCWRSLIPAILPASRPMMRPTRRSR